VHPPPKTNPPLQKSIRGHTYKQHGDPESLLPNLIKVKVKKSCPCAEKKT
jgi:hypothetical protein